MMNVTEWREVDQNEVDGRAQGRDRRSYGVSCNGRPYAFPCEKVGGGEPKDGVKGTRKGSVGSMVGTGTATGGLATVCAVGPTCFLARRWVVGVEFALETMVAVATGHYRRPRWWNEGHR